jgi:putative transposase
MSAIFMADTIFRANLYAAQEGADRTVTPSLAPFVERLIGTVRREYLDRSFFWNATDLARKLNEFSIYYNGSRGHQSLGGSTPEERSDKPPDRRAALDSYVWQQHCRGLFQTPVAV